MENITLGQIATGLGIIAGIITSVSVIIAVISKQVKNQVDKTLTKVIKTSIEPINSQLYEMKSEIKDLTLEQCKNYLVRFVNDINNDEPVSSGEIQRYYETRDRYYGNGGNSYMHSECEAIEDKVRQLMVSVGGR